MSPTMRRAFDAFARVFDVLLSLLIVPAALLLLLYRRFGPRRFVLTTACLRKIGVFPIRDHYYEPLFNPAKLRSGLPAERHLPGIDMNIPGQLAFLARLVYAKELSALKLDAPPAKVTDFSLQNDSFLSGDAEFLYQFLRVTKPTAVIEIGSGNSTKIARLALQKNVQAEGSAPARHVCIEPYEKPWLELLGGIEVVRKLVENCDVPWETALKSGDLLFVDSSHMIRPQGDVLKEYLEIFPRLASGVYIHIHDIFTPRDYLPEWLDKDVRFWNEQYLLEALLSNTDRYEIVGALNFLQHHHRPALHAVCPYLAADREPGSTSGFVDDQPRGSRAELLASHARTDTRSHAPHAAHNSRSLSAPLVRSSGKCISEVGRCALRRLCLHADTPPSARSSVGNLGAPSTRVSALSRHSKASTPLRSTRYISSSARCGEWQRCSAV